MLGALITNIAIQWTTSASPNDVRFDGALVSCMLFSIIVCSVLIWTMYFIVMALTFWMVVNIIIYSSGLLQISQNALKAFLNESYWCRCCCFCCFCSARSKSTFNKMDLHKVGKTYSKTSLPILLFRTLYLAIYRSHHSYSRYVGQLCQRILLSWDQHICVYSRTNYSNGTNFNAIQVKQKIINSIFHLQNTN